MVKNFYHFDILLYSRTCNYTKIFSEERVRRIDGITGLISVDVRQLHSGEIRVVHSGGMPGRVVANFGGPATGRWRPLVRNVLGACDLLQRDTDRLHHAEAASTQQGSEGIQF